jgi:hypothetical protein
MSFVVPYEFQAAAGQATVQQQGEHVVYTGPVDYEYELEAPVPLLNQVFSFADADTNLTVTAQRAALGSFLTAAFTSDKVTGGSNGQMKGDLQEVVNNLINAWLTQAQEYGRDLSQVQVTPAALVSSIQDVLSPATGSVSAVVAQVLQSIYEQAISADADRVATGTAADPGAAADNGNIMYRIGDVLEFIFRVSFQETPITVATPTNVDLLPAGFTTSAAVPSIAAMPAHSGLVIRFKISLYDDLIRSSPSDLTTAIGNVLKPGEQIVDKASNVALVYTTGGLLNLVSTVDSSVSWTSTQAPAEGTTAGMLVIMNDGELIARDSAGTAYWTSNTGGGALAPYVARVSGTTFTVAGSDSTAVFTKP